MSTISIRALVKSSLPSGFRTNYESIAKNLSVYPYVINKTAGVITSIVYSQDAVNTITKTFTYNNGVLSYVTITGTNLGATYTKTLTYSGSDIVGASYTVTT
jgi:Na+/phosphate symporter